jgi:hypothetical protein
MLHALADLAPILYNPVIVSPPLWDMWKRRTIMTEREKEVWLRKALEMLFSMKIIAYLTVLPY